MIFLDLPDLPKQLELEILDVFALIQPDDSGRVWLENFHSDNIKVASQIYGRGEATLPIDVQDQLQATYNKFFQEPVQFIIGKFENSAGYDLACLPPHCDRERKIAINYLLESGGANVLTCMYQQPRKQHDLTAAENDLYENLKLDVVMCIPEKKWHVYDVQHYHSVENIETTRSMLSIFLPSNPDVNTFKNKYTGLLKKI